MISREGAVVRSGGIFGIDLGSRFTKVAVQAEGTYVRLEQYETIAFYRQFGRRVGRKLAIDLASVGVGTGDDVIATGYGRHTVGLPGFGGAPGEKAPPVRVIPELNAHVTGAIHQTGLRDFTLVDVGGQDTKVIQVRDGIITDFATNDRCAASSGRYLENMATALDVSLDELGQHLDDPVDLNSTCAVFGESELIGKIVEGYDLPSLCAGVNWSMWRRLRPHVEHLRSDVIVFVGGVARNAALRTIVERELRAKVIVPEHYGYNGAIGCCESMAHQPATLTSLNRPQ